jgi:hypothetical protein
VPSTEAADGKDEIQDARIEITKNLPAHRQEDQGDVNAPLLGNETGGKTVSVHVSAYRKMN